MSDVRRRAPQGFDPRAPQENFEDRRNEFDEIQHLLMRIGAWQPSHPDQAWRDVNGAPDGFWFDYNDPSLPMPYAGPLGDALGAADLDNQIAFGRLAGQAQRRGR